MTIGNKIRAGFAVGLLALLAVGALTFWTTTRLAEAVAAVKRTYQVRLDLETFLSLMKDAETGQRGYLLTEDVKYLKPYTLALEQLDQPLERLRKWLEGDDNKQHRVSELQSLMKKKLAELKETIDLTKNNKRKEALALVRNDSGLEFMDQARAIIEDMTNTEMERTMAMTVEAERSTKYALYNIFIGEPVAAIILIAACFYVVRSVAFPLRAAVQQLTSVSAELLAGTSQQAAGAQEQAAAVSETVTTVDEVTQTSDQTARRARSVGELFRRNVESGKTGRQAVEDAIAALHVAGGQVEATAQNILALARQAQSIGEIIAKVNDVAEQTNLLALNAAIEAARAGEHGRGFAVVAGEVKALAEQSKKSTTEIRQILGEIQRATNTAVLSTEEVTKSVSGAGRVAAQAGSTIKTLAEALDEAAQAASQIEASSGQHAAGVAQIHLAMRNVEQAARQALAATRQAEQAAHNLNDLGGQLKKLVG